MGLSRLSVAAFSAIFLTLGTGPICAQTTDPQSSERLRFGFVSAAVDPFETIGIPLLTIEHQEVLDTLFASDHRISAKAATCFNLPQGAKVSKPLPGRTFISEFQIDLKGRADARELANASGEFKLIRKLTYETSEAIKTSVEGRAALQALSSDPLSECLGRNKVIPSAVYAVAGTYTERFEILINGQISADLASKIPEIFRRVLKSTFNLSISGEAATANTIERKQFLSSTVAVAFEPLRVSISDYRRKMARYRDWSFFRDTVQVIREKDGYKLIVDEKACRRAKESAQDEMKQFNDSLANSDPKELMQFDPENKEHRLYGAIVNYLRHIELQCREIG